MENTVNFKKIYQDMIAVKYPDKADQCHPILRRKTLSVLDMIRLNTLISRNVRSVSNQRLKSYNRPAIFEILDHQKKHRLNNSQTAKAFGTSRNSIAKWKKIYF